MVEGRDGGEWRSEETSVVPPTRVSLQVPRYLAYGTWLVGLYATRTGLQGACSVRHKALINVSGSGFWLGSLQPEKYHVPSLT